MIGIFMKNDVPACKNLFGAQTIEFVGFTQKKNTMPYAGIKLMRNMCIFCLCKTTENSYMRESGTLTMKDFIWFFVLEKGGWKSIDEMDNG